MPPRKAQLANARPTSLNSSGSNSSGRLSGGRVSGNFTNLLRESQRPSMMAKIQQVSAGVERKLLQGTRRCLEAEWVPEAVDKDNMRWSDRVGRWQNRYIDYANGLWKWCRCSCWRGAKLVGKGEEGELPEHRPKDLFSRQLLHEQLEVVFESMPDVNAWRSIEEVLAAHSDAGYASEPQGRRHQCQEILRCLVWGQNQVGYHAHEDTEGVASQDRRYLLLLEEVHAFKELMDQLENGKLSSYYGLFTIMRLIDFTGGAGAVLGKPWIGRRGVQVAAISTFLVQIFVPILLMLQVYSTFGTNFFCPHTSIDHQEDFIVSLKVLESNELQRYLMMFVALLYASRIFMKQGIGISLELSQSMAEECDDYSTRSEVMKKFRYSRLYLYGLIDQFMGREFELFIYFINLTVLMSTGEVSETILNTLALEFILELDNEFKFYCLKIYDMPLRRQIWQSHAHSAKYLPSMTFSYLQKGREMFFLTVATLLAPMVGLWAYYCS